MTRRQLDQQLVNIDAEKLFLGSLMLSEHAFWAVEGSIRPDTFIVQVHRDLFNNISDVLKSGGKLSHAVLCTRLPEETDGPNGDPVTTRSYLAALTHNAEVAGINPSDLASQLSELAARRQAIQIGERLIKAARAGDKPVIDVAGEAEMSLLDVMQITSPKRPRRLSEVSDGVLSMSKRSRDGDVLPGYTTGLPSLDEIIGLFMGGDLIVVLGAQGDGKSALLAQFGMHVAKTRPVLNCHNEMGEEQVAVRQVAAMSGLSVRAIREGAYNIHEWEMINEAGRELKKPEFWIISDPSFSVRSIRAHALAMQRTIGLGAICIDQLTHIKTETRHKDRFERLAEVTSSLKQLAMELGVPVILAAQRTRFSQRRDDPTPQIDDADTTSIERDSDIVLGIWRKETWLRKNKPNVKAGGEAHDAWEGQVAKARGIVEIITLKLRSGQAYEQRQFIWDGAATMVREMK